MIHLSYLHIVWDKEFLVTRDLLIPWPVLFEWIPARMDWWLARLRRQG
jgi:hypothetical protein